MAGRGELPSALPDLRYQAVCRMCGYREHFPMEHEALTAALQHESGTGHPCVVTPGAA
jgi:hypothetical protein